MLPYMSQGAAMAVEDGVGFARALSKIQAVDQIADALSVFEAVRNQRTCHMQDASLLNGQIWHFPDGPLQQARDAAMLPETKGEHFVHSSNQWSEPTTQLWAYGYDTEGEIDSKCETRMVTTKVTNGINDRE
jgi:salicylate hydroxylase